MKKHKNLIMIIVAVILLIYAGLISLYPMIMTASFNKEEFEKKAYTATGLRTSIGSINFEMTPSFTLIITITKWSSKYVDYQDCFDADYIELKTGAFSPITKNFPIKEMFLKHVNFSNQMLMPERVNKLAYLQKSFEASAFGTKKVTIKAGPVTVKDFKIKHIAPGIYKEDYRHQSKYSKAEVKKFLKTANIRYVDVK